MDAAALAALVRTVPDFPRAGIAFRDVTTLMRDGAGFAAAVSALAERASDAGARTVAGIEARGFVFGAAVAAQLGAGFVPLRKPGKLPVPAIGIDYALEYGADRLELDPGAVGPGDRVALIDDLIATGGTARAGAQLLRTAGADLVAALFVIALPDLGGTRSLETMGIATDSLLVFPGH